MKFFICCVSVFGVSDFTCLFICSGLRICLYDFGNQKTCTREISNTLDFLLKWLQKCICRYYMCLRNNKEKKCERGGHRE